MKRFFVSFSLEVNSKFNIDGIEHNHIKNVMRMKVGDEIILVCGDEYDYMATITNLSKGDTEVYVNSRVKNVYNPNSDVTVFQALVKSDNMALIVQKLTELGVKTLVPFESEYITSKDKSTKVAKLQDISNQSIKQCKRSIPMKVEPTMTFSQVVDSMKDYDLILFANECERTYKLADLNIASSIKVAIIIGSEGGFSEKEISELVSAGAKSITLGKRILRAETASIALTAVVMSNIGEWEYE